MGRPRKAPRLEIEENDDFSSENTAFLPSIASPARPEAPVAVQRHRIVTEFEKEVPVDEIDGGPQPVVVDPEPGTTSPPSPALPEDVASLIQEVGSDEDRFQLKVWQLPNYQRDGRTDTTSRVYCGILDFTRDYESIIQSRWGLRGGDFKVDIIRNGKPLAGGSLPVLTCAPLQAEEPGAPLPPYGYVIEAPAAPLAEAAPAPPSLKAQLKELAELRQFMDTIFPRQSEPNPVAPPDPETALLSLLAKEPEVMDRVAKGALGKLMGDAPREENPWAEVALEAIKSGQAANMLQAGINALFNGLRSMTPTPQQVVAPPAANPMAQAPPPPLPEDVPSMIPAPSPEERVLSLAVDHCLASRPATVAATRILAIADQINDQAPEYSVDGYLQMFITMTPDQAIEFAAQFAERGPLLREVPDVAAWVAQLQAAIGAQLNAEGEE